VRRIRALTARRTARDRSVDALVLAVHPAQIGGALLPGELRGVHPRARKQHRAEVADEVGEMPVARRFRDRQVEAEIRAHRVAGLRHLLRERVQRAPHRAQVRRRAPLGGQRGGLRFNADAQLEDRDQFIQRRAAHGIDAERRAVGALAHEGADAVARFHQFRRLQARHRLAHHGAADAESARDLRLRGQLVARLELAAADAPGEPLDHRVGELARLLVFWWHGLTMAGAAKSNLVV
jgi:hypothetical protein